MFYENYFCVVARMKIKSFEIIINVTWSWFYFKVRRFQKMGIKKKLNKRFRFMHIFGDIDK